jgi:hypothetical protein
VDFQGESQQQLWQAFAKRGFGVLAQTGDGDSVHISESHETPGDTPQIKFYDGQITFGEPVRLVVHDSKATGRTVRVRVSTMYGDSEDVYLDRDGEKYTGTLSTTSGAVSSQNDGILAVAAGDTLTASYGGAQATAAVTPTYAIAISAPSFQFGNETALGLRSSVMAATRVSLPFSFPFYDKSYNAVWVYNNGLLSFSGQVAASCSDLSTLVKHAAIASVWMTGLRTSGSAQPNEDVYRSNGSDFVTFRWAAEAFTVAGTLEPVNFSVTLYKDGRVEQHYGTGNHNLVANSCGIFTPPLWGLANGHETFTQSITPANALNLDSMPTYLWLPPFGGTSNPAGAVESPASGDHVHGIFNVTGIRYDSDSFVTRTDLLIDGALASRSSTTLSRTDVCGAQAISGCPFIGFRIQVNPYSLGLAPGNHTLQILVTNGRGGVSRIPTDAVAFVLDDLASPITGAIESIVNGMELSGTVVVRGYAYSPDLQVTGVDVLVDGITFGSALYGLARTDICDASATSPNCPGVGFLSTLNTRSTSLPLSPGPHTLSVRVRDERGAYTAVPETPLNVTVK